MKLTTRNIPIVAAVLLLGMTTAALAKPAVTAATTVTLKPTAEQAQAALLATRFLTRFHYKSEPLDAAMSEKIFDRFFDSIDSQRLFFTQADIDRFAPDRDKLGDAIYDEDLSVPFAIFNLYVQRVGERTAHARARLQQGFDFSRDENYTYEREHAPWARSVAELDDLWRQRVKNDWLRLKLAGQDDAKIRATLDKRYSTYLDRIHQLDSEDVFQTFMNAYAMSIDPHTNYLGPRASENFDIAMKLSLEGIGAVLTTRDEYTAIDKIVTGGPAALSKKLQAGDRILGIGQGATGPITDVVGWRLDDVVDLIRGPKDTTVRLEVLPADTGPDGQHEMISLVRKKVTIEEQAAKSSVIDVDDGGTTRRVGVIALPTFYEDFDARRRGDKNYKSAARDVARLLGELKAKHVDAVLMDLRNNGGGSLSEAIDLTGLFVGKGPVVQVRSANGRVQEGTNTNTDMTWSGPFAVLVNRNSASASEIFAGAIQDYGRGLIIGENTYGKGTVQNLVDLDQMSQSEKPAFGELKMTIQQFFRVDGASTQLHGVQPDIAFPVTGDFAENGEATYKNALPWASIGPADFKPSADLKSILPMLKTLHATRVAKDKPWLAYEADITDARKLRAETSISLNEKARRAERDAQEAKRKQRHPELARADAPDTAASPTPAQTGSAMKKGESADQARQAVATAKSTTTPAVATDPSQDDGLQADERSIQERHAEEKARKEQPDVVLDEAAHILADEVTLLRSDTRLAARALPHAAGMDKPVD